MRGLVLITLLGLAQLPALAEANTVDSVLAVAASYSITAPAKSDLGRAVARLRTGQYRSASILFKSLADGSMNLGVVLMSGFAHLGAGEIGRARIYFARSLGLDCGNALSMHGLGLVALAQGDRIAAVGQLAGLDRLRRQCQSQCRNSHEIALAGNSLRRAIG